MPEMPRMPRAEGQAPGAGPGAGGEKSQMINELATLLSRAEQILQQLGPDAPPAAVQDVEQLRQRAPGAGAPPAGAGGSPGGQQVDPQQLERIARRMPRG